MHGGAGQRQPLLTRTRVKLGCGRYAAKPTEGDDGRLARRTVAILVVATISTISVIAVFVRGLFVVWVAFVVRVVVPLVTVTSSVVPALACHSDFPCQLGAMSMQSR